MSGRFITFEGIDGAGKSTHLDAIAQRLAERGARVVRTREPGGTALAEALRAQLLVSPMDALTEALIVFAGRRDHLNQVIRPALTRGDTVLCDRFTDATFAYQGHGGGADLETLAYLERTVQGDLQPALTIWFDLPPRLAAERRSAARPADRFEQQDVDFFERVRAGYQARHDAAPRRFARVDAALDREAVRDQIAAVLDARGW